MRPLFKVLILFSFKSGDQAIICEYEQGTITCPSGSTVNIHSASYGRTSTSVCVRVHMSDTNCDSNEDISGILQNHCASQADPSSCTVTVTNTFFGVDDPCPYTVKYLTVSYSCGELNDSSLLRDIVTFFFLIRSSQEK